MFESLVKIVHSVKEAIVGPLCAPNDFLCRMTDGRWSFPPFLTSTPLGKFLVSSSFMIGAVGLSFAAYTGLYHRDKNRAKNPTSTDKLLVGSAEQLSAFAGATLVLGGFPVLEEAPYYLSRYGAEVVINPSQTVPKDLKSFIFDRFKDINITALNLLIMNGIQSVFPYKGIFSPTLFGAIKKAISGIIDRSEDKLMARNTDNSPAVFDTNKIMKDTLKGACLYATLDLSLQILSDYLIDGDRDPSKYSYSAFILSGIVAESVYQYGLKKVEEYFATPVMPKRQSPRRR